jgi:hypothetical protein
MFFVQYGRERNQDAKDDIWTSRSLLYSMFDKDLWVNFHVEVLSLEATIPPKSIKVFMPYANIVKYSKRV